MPYKSFEEMPVWKLALEIAEKIFAITISLPKCEDYGLTSQIRRAAVSVFSNIAEGYGRETQLDKKKFYNIARGSAYETKSQLIYGKNVKYFNENECNEIIVLIEKNIHELNKLIKHFKPQPQSQPQSQSQPQPQSQSQPQP